MIAFIMRNLFCRYGNHASTVMLSPESGKVSLCCRYCEKDLNRW